MIPSHMACAGLNPAESRPWHCAEEAVAGHLAGKEGKRLGWREWRMEDEGGGSVLHLGNTK